LKLLRLLESLGCHVNSPSLGIGARIRVSACKCGKARQIGSISRTPTWRERAGFASEALLNISGNATYQAQSVRNALAIGRPELLPTDQLL
jgi:hypothetical protein